MFAVVAGLASITEPRQKCDDDHTHATACQKKNCYQPDRVHLCAPFWRGIAGRLARVASVERCAAAPGVNGLTLTRNAEETSDVTLFARLGTQT